jgi:hypothetical protein
VERLMTALSLAWQIEEGIGNKKDNIGMSLIRKYLQVEGVKLSKHISRITIHAPVHSVWDALTKLKLVKQWQYGSHLHT